MTCKGKNICYLALYKQGLLTTYLDKESSKYVVWTLLVLMDALKKRSNIFRKSTNFISLSEPYKPH